MSRTKGILAAGTFTGLVLITILALGFGSIGRSQAQLDANMTSDPVIESALPAANGMSSEDALRAWQEYSAQLEQTVRTLQVRDTAYQQQLDAANGTILQLQEQINNNPARPSFGEHEREEHEEHEREEHGSFEFGEFDD